jgi:hypothetical protein
VFGRDEHLDVEVLDIRPAGEPNPPEKELQRRGPGAGSGPAGRTFTGRRPAPALQAGAVGDLDQPAGVDRSAQAGPGIPRPATFLTVMSPPRFLARRIRRGSGELLVVVACRSAVSADRRPLQREALPPKWRNKSVHKGPDRNHLGGKAPLARWPSRSRAQLPSATLPAPGRSGRGETVRSQEYRGARWSHPQPGTWPCQHPGRENCHLAGIHLMVVIVISIDTAPRGVPLMSLSRAQQKALPARVR